MNKTIRNLALLCMAAPSLAMAQGTLEDYQRAYSLGEKLNAKYLYHAASEIRWNEPSNSFSYTKYTPEGRVYVVVNPETKEKKEFATPEAIQAHLGASRERTGERGERFDRGERNRTQQRKWYEQPARQRHWMEVDDEKGNNPVLAPDSSFYAFIKDDNLYIADKEGKNQRALTQDGTLSNYYSSWISWSPDSKWVTVNRIRDIADRRYVYYVEAAPKGQEQPKLHKQEYPKPGDELRQKQPVLIEVATGRKIVPDNALFTQQYDLGRARWDEDSKAITFEYNQRGHQIYRLLECSVETGKVRTVIEESSQTFVNYGRIYRQHLKGDKEILWMSERDNWAHLYLIDRATSKVKKQITKGDWCVRRVLHVDEENRTIFFTASGMNKEEDPYHVHYYRIDFDGKNLISLTPENGNHNATFNRDYTLLMDTYSTVEQAPKTTLRSAIDGKELLAVECADNSKLIENGWMAPEIFVAPGRDGETPIWGIIQRPTNFDPTRQYPIIEYIYAGPGDAYTPKSFIAYNRNMSVLAELGFIVVQLDGMGTSYRGKKFEEVCYKNLKDAGFPDRKAWIKAAAEKYPYMDAERVGIFGASAGGQESTTAVLLHPEFYKAAYSSCGCHDNRMDKIWWNEQWMGYPIDSAYVESSNVYHAHKLTRPLMLVVGELDDNVDPASTMQVVDALVKAEKDFELVVLPGVGHTMGESFGERKRYDFFVRNLLKVIPPQWSDVKKK